VKLSNTLILGIGNTLLSDEGAGIHALNLLRSLHPNLPNVTCIDGGTLSFTLAAYIEDCANLIVLDAAELKAPAGTVQSMDGVDMDAFLGAARRSPHEVGLLDLFDMARLTGSLPDNRALIGIQPGRIDWGMLPTAEVETALPQAVEQVVRLLGKWRAAEMQGNGNRACGPATTAGAVTVAGEPA